MTGSSSGADADHQRQRLRGRQHSRSVTVGSTVYQGAQITSVSATQLAVSVNVGVAPQSLPVKVTDPSGQVSNNVTLSVTAPVVAPAISSVSPNPMTGSTSAQTLTINGSGFQSRL